MTTFEITDSFGQPIGHHEMLSPMAAAYWAERETKRYLRARDGIHMLHNYLQSGLKDKVLLDADTPLAEMDPYVLTLEGCRPPDRTGLSIQHLGTEEKLPWQQ